MARIAHAHGRPLIVDAASTLPPAGHLTRWTDQGADLVIYSGGKGIRGPQGTGLLVGRADLVRAAAANAAPNAAVGRPCKVGKEDLVALVVALERFLEADHDAEWARHAGEAAHIAAAVAGLPGVRAHVEDDRRVWTSPSVLVRLDPAVTGRTPADVQGALRAGEPPIMVRVFEGDLLVDPHCLQPGEAEVVDAPSAGADASLAGAVGALRAKYPQYADVPLFLGRPTALAIRIVDARGWCASPAALPRE